jgi:energy-coupling factor transport system ATP-binding protein
MRKIIEIKNLSYTYLPGSCYEQQALKNITFSLDQGEMLGIFGPNGSGKTTLAQHLNGLLYSVPDTVTVCGLDTADKKTRHELWKKVGLVFQYPEHQIFQVSVYDEIAYGLRNMGIDEKEIKNRVWNALRKVGINPLEITENVTPFRLSGGLRRRIAIAGILALNPEILVMDEPMAGLDPAGRKIILDLIKDRKDNNETTIMISHNLKEIIALADKIAILDNGVLVFFGGVKQLLDDTEMLCNFHYELPEYLQVVYCLTAKGLKVNTNISSINEAVLEISKIIV